MGDRQARHLHGVLDLLILNSVKVEALHGYGIAQLLNAGGDGQIVFKSSSLYSAIRRLEDGGMLGAEWRTSHTGRPVKSYRLTSVGCSELRRALEEWGQFVLTVGEILSDPDQIEPRESAREPGQALEK